MDVGALVGGGVALVVGLFSWTQSRATNRRSDFTAITERLDKEVKEERTQRKLLTRAYLDLLLWARRASTGCTSARARAARTGEYCLDSRALHALALECSRTPARPRTP